MATKSEQSVSDAGKALSALGAHKGGRARANVLTAGQRSDIAKKAIRARWEKAGKPTKTKEMTVVGEDSGPPDETATGPTTPYSMLPGKLQFGEVELECHVLNDLRRVLTQREVVRAISGGRESGNIQRYLSRNPLTATNFDIGELIRFKVSGGAMAIGYEATKLIEICSKYTEARDTGLLKGTQIKLAIQSGIILRACAKIGIIALIDEATGFQKIREKRSLQLKLQAFIAEEIQEWALMFPEEFWLQLARLESVHYSPRARPLRWGKYVMMFVYDAIDKDVGRELRKKNPNPRFLQNHHQWLKHFGRQKVNNQIQRVIGVMATCADMDEFKNKFSHIFKADPSQLTWDDWVRPADSMSV